MRWNRAILEEVEEAEAEAEEEHNFLQDVLCCQRFTSVSALSFTVSVRGTRNGCKIYETGMIAGQRSPLPIC